MAPTFLTEFDPRYGEPVAVSDGVVRVVADNPSKYTAWGTGTYVVGEAQVAVIDPGPDLPAHVDALLAALDGRAVSHILITHTRGPLARGRRAGGGDGSSHLRVRAPSDRCRNRRRRGRRAGCGRPA